MKDLAAKKDRNVWRSSHGKFASVGALEKHRIKISKPIPHKKAERLIASDHWTSRDHQNRDRFIDTYLRYCAA